VTEEPQDTPPAYEEIFANTSSNKSSEDGKDGGSSSSSGVRVSTFTPFLEEEMSCIKLSKRCDLTRRPVPSAPTMEEVEEPSAPPMEEEEKLEQAR
jgi:hypothetical protein